MTTIERYRPPQHFISDAPSIGPTTNSSSNSLVSNIPPAVPSPPRLSRNSPPPRPNTTKIRVPPATMAVDQLSQWLFAPDELKATPSMCDGLHPAEERCRRAKGVNFIIQVGILLKLPQMTIGVASTFFHRFYMRRSMVEKKGGLHHYVSFSAPRAILPSAYRGSQADANFPAELQILMYNPYHRASQQPPSSLQPKPKNAVAKPKKSSSLSQKSPKRMPPS